MPGLHPGRLGLGLFCKSGIKKNDLEFLSCGTKAMKVEWDKKFLRSSVFKSKTDFQSK